VLYLPCLSARTSGYKDFNATQTSLMKTKLNFGNSTKIGRRISVLIKLSRNTHFSLITTCTCVSARISGVIGASFAENLLQQTFLFFPKNIVEDKNEMQIQCSSLFFCLPRQLNKGYVYGVSFHNSRKDGLNWIGCINP